MTLEELSWFVDDTVVRALQGVKGVGAVERFGGVDREIRVALDPDRLLALRHHRRRRQPPAARDQRRPGRRPRRDRRPRAGDPHARRHADGRGPRRDRRSRCRGGRKVRLDELGTVTDATAEPRTFAALDGKPVVAFAHLARQGRQRRRRRPPTSPRRSTSCRQAHPDVELDSSIDTTVDYTLGNYHSAMKTLIEGAVLAVHRGVHLPARLARDADRRHRAAAVDHPDLLGDGRDRLLAQPRQPARHHARHRHPGRRRHRRDREHRAPHAHGQDRPIAPRWRPPTRSASPSSPSPSRSSRCSCR